ncbi:DUF1576 domain-containing protein [Tetragenococcus halophilus]|uniref:DUF1576 domain-containing protein n=1 Tax=Tetragenococcus halophilus TaxID=51669 RepID=UPI001F33BF02|nr:DUF1576 domain-containing protein [Tetragenococcus halophilus]MCF1685830.1 DUF1576 domain-containing protein [Tetragenococcus halophilus]
MKNFIRKQKVQLIILLYILIFIFYGLLMQPFDELSAGLMRIFTASGILITDYVEIGGLGASFVNAGLVGLIGYIILIINKVELSGVSIATLFTMIGFALMGKTIWSILPVIFGVFVYSKLTKREFITNIYPALFGTALAPIVTHASFEFELGVLGGVIDGFVAGLVIAPIANHSLSFHEGYNLYNVGFSAGLIGLVLMNVFRAFDHDTESLLMWGSAFDSQLRIFSIGLFVSMVLVGALCSDNLKDYRKVLKEPGNTITDFVDIVGFGNTLINMGFVGLVGVVFVELLGTSYNGPVLSGLLTMVGFAGFGKHPLNITPIMIGVVFASFLSIYEINAPGTVLAGLFGTTLAPIAGQFGALIGVMAGMLHLYIVSTIGEIHGGMNLYNNGFSGGLVASLVVAVMKGIGKNNN